MGRTLFTEKWQCVWKWGRGDDGVVLHGNEDCVRTRGEGARRGVGASIWTCV